MNVVQASVLITTLCLSSNILIIPATANHSPQDSIAISCGSSGSSIAPYQRVWMGDSGFKSSFPFQIIGKPTKLKANSLLASPDSAIYKTARASRREFSYIFPRLSQGQKFIRLHFHQDSYKGFKGSTASFSVKAGPYTLLSNFGVMAAKQIVKEFCINVDEDQPLVIAFAPAQKSRKSDDFYAFVNGIEVVSMPTGLYFSPEGRKFGARVVGQRHRFFYIDNATALELVQRMNVGGAAIPPAEDSRMFRRWDEDTRYLSETGDVRVTSSITIRHTSTHTQVAPTKIYQTARAVHSNNKLSTKGITWKIQVDLGFRYLIRLHSSEFRASIEHRSDKKFSLLVNNQIAVENADVIQSDEMSEAEAYRDYVATMEGDKTKGKRDLTITFQANFGSSDDQFVSMLNGLEIFKLSNPDNNLAGMVPAPELQSSTPKQQQNKPPLANSIDMVVTVLTLILAALNIIVYHLKSVWDSKSGRTKIRSSLMGHLCRQFSIDEIRSSTNNFDPQFHIGSGGYGRVYKGSIDGGATTVAIKRLKTDSRQGENEFWTEIKMLSKIRNDHLVSLIGYCNDGEERLLVYQYMPRGTLFDHLHEINRQGKSNPPLPWEQRLKISIGAAYGLYYLHSRCRVIHRDVKSSNILLDENWVAKISDFGLSKMGPANDSFSHISTLVKGTFGYLDPEYFLTRKLTRKSDVYSFGVVLFEVLSGRPAVDMRLEEEQHSLAGWARYCIREGKADRLIDHSLMGQITPACLKVFVGIAGRCLHTQPQGRPAMADVVMALELALALQQTKDDQNEQDEEENSGGRTYSDHSDGVISMDDVSVTSLKQESYRMNCEDNLSANGSSDRKDSKIKTKNTSSHNNQLSKWWWDPFGILPRMPSKSRASPSFPHVIIHEFSLQDIQRATNNFHNSLVIGFGGSDHVYKGYIDGGQKAVAIRWSRTAESKLRMAQELRSKKEIQMKSSLYQDHVASLIGYCETESDIMLVYDYMVNGTLHDQLHEPNMDPLTWKQRLQICIGAVRGVSCIHSIVKQTMLNRNLKSNNIWLDRNWVPKVSEWGLFRKQGNDQVATVAKSYWGCLDSDYVRGEQATEKSTAYSLGLILFEVIFADKESDRWLDEDQVSLAQWIESCMRNNLSDRIDPFLVGRMAPESLKIFIETAGRCLLGRGIDRPSIFDIVTRLEEALKRQEATEGHKDAHLVRS